METGIEERRVYHRGWIPIPTTYWRVEDLSTQRTIGYIMLPGATVSREMDRARSIVHHEPYDIVHRIARSRWPGRWIWVTQSTRAHMVRWRRTH